MRRARWRRRARVDVAATMAERWLCSRSMQRRTLLASVPALLARAALADDHAPFAPPRPLARVRAEPDRLIDYAVCTRPFRMSGPRIEAQPWRGKVLVH